MDVVVCFILFIFRYFSDGYMERNLKRWIGNFNMAKTEEIPEMDRIIKYLENNLPKNPTATIVHGDYR